MIELRPHHGMCIGQFIGKGYNEEFIRNMTLVITELEKKPDDLIQLVCKADSICHSCPHNHNKVCNSGQKVKDYDNACLMLCELEENQIISWRDFKHRVKSNIINKNRIHEVCVNCSWISICIEHAGRNY